MISVNATQKKIDKLDLIWIDSEIGKEENERYRKMLENMFEVVHCFQNEEAFKQFEKKIKDRRFILLVSGRIGEALAKSGFESNNMYS